MVRVGVLALQGAFDLHRRHVLALGAGFHEVVTSRDLAAVDALILPGGESGTMLKLIASVGIGDDLGRFLKAKPCWGICAGAILMAKTVRNPSQWSFEAVDVEIERNAYGRQLESTQELVVGIESAPIARSFAYEVSYIRAPRILSVGAGVTVLAERDGFPTWVESGSRMMTTFHPETNLDAPSPWHKRLIELSTTL